MSALAPPPAPPEAPAEDAVVRTPVDVRSVSLAVLAVLASVVVLHWAKEVFIPLLVGVMVSYALTPVVDRLERWRVPRGVGAALLLAALVGGTGWIGYGLSDDAVNLVESLPEAAQKLRLSMHRTRAEPSRAIEKVQKAATELERAADESAAASSPAARGVTRVQIEKPHFNVRDWLLPGTLGLATLVGQAVVVLFITYFLLLSGNTFRRKMVRIAGPTFAEKRVTVEALDEISAQIERYLLVQLATSALLGVATGLALWALGLQHAAVWGVVAGVTNLIPYFGAIFVVGAAALAAFVQFGEFDRALAVGAAALAIHTFVGYWLTPWLTSRAGRMNPVVVFAGVLAWGWLWGVWGLLLGVPILMVVKAVCDRVESLQPVGELLGD
ncbi:MAG TPA: AI-2E family transporter [Ideonella sp.]|nr:AI-2E family transporter [Ideonella sp.]